MNTNLLTENIKAYEPEIFPKVDVVRDLERKPEFDTNSWFAIGHFQSEAETIDFLYHLMIMKANGNEVMVSCFSVTNETTGWYDGIDEIFPMQMVKKTDGGFGFQTPTGCMSGDLDHMQIAASMKSASMALTLKAVGYPLYNEGSGNFDMLGMNINQYSIPTMEAEGLITIEGKAFDVQGTVWFDRQWQNQDGVLAGKWSWMDINLENGERISLWDAVDPAGDTKSWVTILHEDGSQTVADMVPLAETTGEYWTSEKSGNKYPGKWTVKIPEVQAELEVTPTKLDQEIAGQKGLAHYEGASTVKGTYKGQPVKGYSYIELVGQWDR